MQLEQVVVVVMEVQRQALAVDTRACRGDLGPQGLQGGGIGGHIGLGHLERHMAVGTRRRLALHEGQPHAAQQQELFARQREVAPLAVVDLGRPQSLDKQARRALHIAHDERQVADAQDRHARFTARGLGATAPGQSPPGSPPAPGGCSSSSLSPRSPKPWP